MTGLHHPTRNSVLLLLGLLSAAGSVAAQDAASAAPGCSTRWSTLGSLGINQFSCDCTFDRTDNGGVWRFRGEPQILGISSGGPAEGRLRPGDVIVALDGMLITTRAAGQRISNLEPDVPVTLTIRRHGREIQVEVTPNEPCDESDMAPSAAPAVIGAPPRAVRSPRASMPAVLAPPSPSPPSMGVVGPVGAMAPAAPSALAEFRPTAWFGFGINCHECSVDLSNRRELEAREAELRALRYRSPDTAATVRELESMVDELRSQGAEWRFSDYPTVYSVDPKSPADRAGIRRGDILTRIDGISLLTSEGGRRFGATRPGESVTWTYQRGGVERTARMTAVERPGEPSAVALTSRLSEVRAAMERLQADQSNRGSAEVAQLSQALARVEATRAAASSEIAAAAETQHLRFAGSVGNTDVEVRGLSSVDVSYDNSTGELLIHTSDATIRVKAPAKQP